MTSPDHDHRMTNFRGGLLSFGEVGCPRVATPSPPATDQSGSAVTSGVEKITIWNSCPKVQYRSNSPCGRVLAMSVVRNPRRTLWSDADRRRPDFQVTPVVSIDFNLNTRPATLV
ncbi:hypothetical protein CN186_20080 [Sinorhizobium medicae]|nr:hypothetical protein CN186_20080 [Sinorhizobium medicae]